MSREEAAVVFIDRLLGFAGAYPAFLKASETLTDEEKELLVRATTGSLRDRSNE